MITAPSKYSTSWSSFVLSYVTQSLSLLQPFCIAHTIGIYLSIPEQTITIAVASDIVYRLNHVPSLIEYVDDCFIGLPTHTQQIACAFYVIDKIINSTQFAVDIFHSPTASGANVTVAFSDQVLAENCSHAERSKCRTMHDERRCIICMFTACGYDARFPVNLNRFVTLGKLCVYHP